MKEVRGILVMVACWGVVVGQGEDWRLMANEIWDTTSLITEEGIVYYDNFNRVLKGDSVRYCGDYVCDGWVSDYYNNGQLAHRGFYVMGELQIYTNYYPDGRKEREFTELGNKIRILTSYYRNGKQRASIKFNKRNKVVEMTLYYPEGNVMIYEKYDEGGDVLLEKKEYYRNGVVAKHTFIADKKKKSYGYREYFERSTIKVAGYMVCDKDGSLLNDGKWQYFDENGVLLKEEKYDRGRKIGEKTY